MPLRSRAWTFTINNYTFDDLVLVLETECRYLCFGFEYGPKCGTPHIQGYIYFDNQRTREYVKTRLPRAWFAPSKGDPDQNANYTGEDGDWWEFGDKPSPGVTPWDKIETAMSDPRLHPHTFNQYNKMYRAVTLGEIKDHERQLHLISKDNMFKVFERYDPAEIFSEEDMQAWNGERVVFLDFLRYSDPIGIERWVRGYPISMKRGYEILKLDPEIVYIMYSSTIEMLTIKKRYGDFLIF